jgi:hypothetical protein
MDELTARLEALLRVYAAAFDSPLGLTPLNDPMGRQFREEIRLLITNYGHAALNKLAGVSWPSVALH